MIRSEPVGPQPAADPHIAAGIVDLIDALVERIVAEEHDALRRAFV